MSQTIVERLYPLLPEVYRRRDADAGQPLRALMQVLEEPLAALERDIQQLYDNSFIETCAEWVVPYIGDLLGVRLVHATAGEGLTLRAFVANTLGFRRRKGTVGLLERVAQDVTGFPAAAVEYFQLLAATQNVNHVRPGAPGTVNIGKRSGLDTLGGPFDTAPYNVDIRSIQSGRGRTNIRNIGIFLWTLRSLKAEKVTPAPALDAGPAGSGFYRVSPLGQDQAMWNPRLTTERLDVRQTADQVPQPLERFALFNRFQALRAGTGDPDDVTLLPEKFKIFLNNSATPVDPAQIAICNLSTWHRPSAIASPLTSPPKPIVLAIDPILGRIALAAAPPAGQPIQVSYFYGAPGDIGGGVYVRPPVDDGIAGSPGPIVVPVSGGGLIDNNRFSPAVTQWLNNPSNGLPVRVVIEIGDSGSYLLTNALTVPDNVHLEIRAERSGPARPLLVASPSSTPVTVTLGKGSQLTFEGVWISAALRVNGQDSSLLTFAHCTLVPGVALNVPASPPSSPPGSSQPSLSAMNDNALQLVIQRSITGPVLMSSLAGSVTIQDSIVDGLGTSPALKAESLSIQRTTVLGTGTAHEVSLAEDTIFTGVLTIDKTQQGCVRFCFIPDGSRTPRQFRCQPQMALSALNAAKQAAGTVPSAAETAAELARVVPRLISRVYGAAGYARLSPSCPDEIATGGSGESEMGAFQFLQIPMRNSNLQAALNEYLRFGLEVGTFPAVSLRRIS